MTKRANPAVSAAQYGMAQAVLSGASTGMPVSVARELVDKTSPAMRRKFAKQLAGNPGERLYAVGNNQGLMEIRHATQTEAVAYLRKHPMDDMGQHNFIWKSTGSIAGQPSWKKVYITGKRGNPESDAASMYESFHGTPSTGELVIQDQIHYHGNLAELGVLCGLKVRLVTGEDFTLEFGGMPGQMENPSYPGRYKPRFLTDAQMAELFNLFHLARTALAGTSPSKYDQMIWATEEFHKLHPEISATAAYKDLDGARGDYFGRNPKGKRKSKRGPLTTAYSTAQGIVPGLLGIGDGVIRGVTGNPTPGDYSKTLAQFKELEKEGYDGFTVQPYRSRSWDGPFDTPEEAVRVAQRVEASTGHRPKLGATRSGRRSNPSSDSGPVILCSNETGNQLYFRGGDQSLDLDSLNLSDAARDHMVIGEVWALAYSTKKDFDEFAEIEYVHTLGLEKYHVKLPAKADLWEDAQPPKDDAFSCGNLPTLMYDSMNKSLSIAGGIYKIEKPWAETSPGIEN